MMRTGNRYRGFVAAGIISLLIAVAAADTVSDIGHFESNIMNHLAAGDDLSLYESIEALILAMPAHPVASLCYKDLVYLADTVGPDRVEKALTETLQRLSSGKSKNEQSSRLQANLALHLLYSRYYPQKAPLLGKELFTLKKWILAGPFRQYGPGDLHTPFGPELTYDLAQFNNGKKVLTDDLTGVVDPASYLYPDAGIAYAITSFHATAPVKIRIYSGTYYHAYVNRKLVLSNTKGDYRNCRVVKVENCNDITLMLKLYRGDSWSFRTVITDYNDVVLKPAVSLTQLHQKDIKFFQVDDYPHDQLALAGDYGHLGDYFNGCDSREAIGWYQKSLSGKNGAGNKYFMADLMIRLSRGIKGSALYIEGWRTMEETYKSHPDFIPAAHRHLQGVIRSMDKAQAIAEGEKLIARAPFYSPTYVSLLRLYSATGMRKEFFSLLGEFKKRFPQSIHPLVLEYEFWKKRDKAKYIKSLETALQFRYNRKTAQLLVDTYCEAGNHAKAMSLIKTYGGLGDWKDEEIKLLMKAKNFSRAKFRILARVAAKDDPLLYHKLGIIDFFSDMDPSMYWGRMLVLDPSDFTFSDYLDYKNDTTALHPFVKYAWEEKDIAGIFDRFKAAGDYPTVLKRIYVFKLNPDGSSRVFCDEVVYLKTQESAALWGEYKIPFSGNVRPVRVRVYTGPEMFVDSYKSQKIDFHRHFFINSLAKDTLLHISYIVDNPIQEPAYSAFFSSPPLLLQKFDEEVTEASCIVIAPENMQVQFSKNSDEKIITEEADGMTVHRYTLKDLDPVTEEFYSGGESRCLPQISFSTMNKIEQFIAWYNGLLDGLDRLEASPLIDSLKGKSLDETLSKVYSFISNKIELQNNVLFTPAAAEDTLFARRGTPEDKVILAKSILHMLGIESYGALVPKNIISKQGGYISPLQFSHALLYVPVSMDKNLWFDFSNSYYSCGVVSSQAAGATALIVMKKAYDWKVVKETVPTLLENTYEVSIDGSGAGKIALTTIFHGRNGAMRELFIDEDERDQTVSLYMGKKIPSFELDSYSLENIANLDAPFKLAIKGQGQNMAIVTGGGIVLKPVLGKSAVYGYIRYKERKHPLVITTPIHEKEKYHYILPQKSYAQDNVVTKTLDTSFGKARLFIERKTGSNILLVVKEVEVKAAQINTEDYKDFLNFCMRLKDMESIALSIK